MFKNTRLLFYFSLINNIVAKKQYDEEEKDTILKNQEDWNKFLQEQSKNGYIVYTNEFLETLEKIDPKGKDFPIISLIFVGSHCPGCRPFKTTSLIKDLSSNLNNIFNKYINQNENNQIGYKILFVLINLDEKETNNELAKFLNGLPPIYSIPNVFFLCRNKNCNNKNCKKEPNKIRLINNYVGVYFPLDKWIKDVVNDSQEGILKYIKKHNFKEN